MFFFLFFCAFSRVAVLNEGSTLQPQGWPARGWFGGADHIDLIVKLCSVNDSIPLCTERNRILFLHERIYLNFCSGAWVRSVEQAKFWRFEYHLNGKFDSTLLQIKCVWFIDANRSIDWENEASFWMEQVYLTLFSDFDCFSYQLYRLMHFLIDRNFWWTSLMIIMLQSIWGGCSPLPLRMIGGWWVHHVLVYAQNVHQQYEM